MFEGGVGMNEARSTAAWMDADDGWLALHRKLVEVSRQRRVLEAEETELLVEAEDSRLYRRLGHVSMHEYMEAHLGYTRHTANERLRTARELLELPKLREAYRAGELSFTAVRELTRVATPATEEAFLAAAEGKTAGEVQQLVAGRGKGDTPATPPDPRLARRRVVLDLSAEEHAMWMRLRTLVADELGHHVEDGVLVRMLAGLAAEGAGDVSVDAPPRPGGPPGHDEVADDAPSAARTSSVEDMPCAEEHARPITGEPRAKVELTNSERVRAQRAKAERARLERAKAAHAKQRASRPPLLHAVSTCSRCVTTFAVTAGTEAPLTEAERLRTACDAVKIGDVSVDGGRVQYAIPAATRLKVFVRDQFRCAVPGCRARRCLEVHHLVPRSQGGTNALSNLILLCSGHHQLHHEGKLRITGLAPAVEVTWVSPEPDESGRASASTSPPRNRPLSLLKRAR